MKKDNFTKSLIQRSKTYLYINNKDNSIPSIIPDSVTHLNFGHYFNQPLKKDNNSKSIIPDSVIYLTFGNEFNQPLEKGDIPDSVTHLTFGQDFNQELRKGDIPDSVTHLTFGKNFNKPLNDDNLPSNLIEIILDDIYSLRLLKTNKNIVIGIKLIYKVINNIICNKIYNININKSISFPNKYFLNIFIEKHMTKDKFIGQIIFKELIEKILHYDRLKRISNEYNIDVADLLNIY